MPMITGSMSDGAFYRASGYMDAVSSWATLRDATRALAAGSNGARQHLDACVYVNGTSELIRSFYVFDTSEITSTPGTAKFRIYRDYISNLETNPVAVILVKSNAAFDLDTALVNNDFDNIVGFETGEAMTGNTTDYSSVFAANSWTAGDGWNEIELNLAARQDMAALDEFQFTMVSYEYDYLNVEPSVNQLILVRYANPWVSWYGQSEWDHEVYGPRLDYTGSVFAGVTEYEKHIDLEDMAGLSAPTNKGSIYALSGSVNSSSGLIISGSSTYAVNIATGNGAIRADEFVTYSDADLKKNIQPLEKSLETIIQLNPVSYSKKKTGKREIGFIAQDVAKSIPQICDLDENGEGRGIDYSRLSAVVADAIKAQQIQIETHEDKLALIKKILTKLQK